MRVPLAWLRDYVDVELEPERLAERLTLLGMEVKDIERWGADWRHVVVGELLAVEPHPRADRLSLTRVRVGDGEPLEIVCGATNIAIGQRVPVALPGAVLPGDRRIERTEKMGVVSAGMLCSGDELRLTADADGILILPDGAPVGASLTDLLGDVVLDIDVKPNRGDALSLVGLAREVAAATGAEVRFPPTDVEETGADAATRLHVDVDAPELCSRFVGRWISGVTIRPSPDGVQMRLLAAGQRPVSNVVDASNYVMLELGKPIHTFDAAAVRGGRIVVRTARPGEHLETLDHLDRELTTDTLLIADESGPLGIAGVMGGADSEVGPDTTDVIVESAVFDPVSIRRTAFRYGLRSEASLRFEKGQEVRLARLGADRTARLIREWAGGDVAAGRVDSAPTEPEPSRLAFRPARVDRLLGTTLGGEAQRALLARSGIETELPHGETDIPVAGEPQPQVVTAAAGEAVVAIVPTWRGDLAIEADVAEEVARLSGYESTPAHLPDTEMPGFRPSPLGMADLVRRTLAGAGLTEVVTHALVAPEEVERFGPLEEAVLPADEAPAGGPPVTVTNPLSRDHSVLRQSLLGGLLAAMGTNLRHGREDIAIFEIGRGYARQAAGGHEWTRLGFALCGAASPPSWASPSRARDLDDAKGLIELLGDELGLSEARYEPLTNDPNLHPGRAARVRMDLPAGTPGIVGRVGELHPAVVEALELRTDRILVAEIAVVGLSAGSPPPVRAVAPPRQPAVERDLAVVVAEEVAAATVAATIRERAGDLLTDLRLFDVYRGAPLPDDRKSLAWRLTLQATDRTLTDAEVDAVVASVRDGLTGIGGQLRT
jgi:phenylalanyl-tRNA synthetase beta chain